MMRRWMTGVAVLGVLLLAAACAGGVDGGDAQPAPGTAATAADGSRDAADDQAVGESADGPADPDAAGGDGGGVLQVGGSILGRQVIRTAAIDITVADPAVAVDNITRTVERSGGFVATADLHRGDDDLLRGTLVVRVPAGDLSTALAAIEELADEVIARTIASQDVTEEYTDIEAQLTNLTAIETELRALLAEAREDGARADDLLTIFARISEVRGQIEQLQGRQQVLDDQVSLATIEVSLAPSVAAVPVVDEGYRPAEVVRNALTATASAFQHVATGAIWLALTALPIGLVVVAPVVAVVVASRRWSRRRAAGGATSV